MSTNILEIKDMNKIFTSKKTSVQAVSDVSFNMKKGETLGVVGESGCGKTTLGRCICKAIPATSGSVLYNSDEAGELDFLTIDKKTMKKVRKEIQMIFQDPHSSLNPRLSVYDIIAEPLLANYPDMPKKEMDEKIIDVAEKVGLDPTYLKRYPHAFSGGQRQRIGIARAIILEPQVIVCDEPVSALDVSIQAQIINLLIDLKDDMGLTFIFISHDLSVVELISDRVAVMYLGRIVELGKTYDLFSNPKHPYTEALLSAVPVADPSVKMNRIPLEGEIPNPSDPPSGCYFHDRCRYCIDKCKTDRPEKVTLENGHEVECHRYDELNLRGYDYGD